MNFLELVTHRVSVRSYDASRMLSKDVMMQIAEAGRLAPSAANKQPWRFLFVSSEELLDAIRQTYDRNWFIEAPHILIVVGDMEQSWTRSDGYNSLETDLTIAMDHMILMADSLGVATCWVGNFSYPNLRQSLRLKENEMVYALTPLGYPKAGYIAPIEKKRKPIEEVCLFL